MFDILLAVVLSTAPSTDTPPVAPTPPATVEVFWDMPNGGTGSHITWPQTYNPDGEAGIPCGVTDQVDTYLVTEASGFYADNTLTQGEDYANANNSGQRGAISWRFVSGPACQVVTGPPSVRIEPPTCDSKYNMIHYTVPAGLSVNGFTGPGSINYETFPNPQYATPITQDITVLPGYTYAGPLTLTFGPLTDPASLVCSTPTPTPTPTTQLPTPPPTLAETGVTIGWGWAVFAGILLLVGVGLVVLRSQYDKRKAAESNSETGA